MHCSPQYSTFDECDMVVGENVINVSLMYEPVRNHPLIQKTVSNDTHETNMVNQDKDVSNILSDMLETKSQIHKEKDDVTH